jgi:secondary thiamine-phosphate synthase enzyme
MQQAAQDLTVSTGGEVEIVDLTDDVARIVDGAGVRTGQALVHTLSSTSAITTLEHEPGLVEEDVPEALERLFPRHGDEAPVADDGEPGTRTMDYGHQRRWQDGNGHSHVRAAFLGPDVTAPVADGALRLGTWEQIVLVELDNEPRERTIAVHCWGIADDPA